MKKKIIILLLLICLSVIPFSKVKGNSDDNLTEEKFVCDYSIDDDFASDSVLVVFNNKESRKLEDYDSKYFNNIGVEKVYDLSSSTKGILRMIRDNDYSFLRGENDIRTRLSVDNYHQILKIALSEKTKENVLSTIDKLMEYDDIIVAEPNYKVEACTIPNEWNNLTAEYKWGHNKIDLPSAWSYATSSNNVLVGVIDSGIDGDHEDLSGNMYSSSSFYDFTSESCVQVGPNDYYNSHGTHVAGIIGAVGNNYINYNNKMVGVCWSTKLISLAAIGQNNNMVSSTVAAIDYANGNGIDILNFSNGENDFNLSTLRIAIGGYEGLFVCSAGNRGWDNDYYSYYPANYRHSNMIVVGNSDENDCIVNDSCFGQNNVDLFAPGYEIYSTLPNNQYGFMSGTSMSAPFVTGVAALILGQNSSLTPQEVKSIIMNNVDVLDSLAGLCVSNGRLNAYKAIRAAVESKTLHGDVNGDGYEDLIFIKKSSSYYRFLVFKGNSSGSFDYTPLDTTTSVTYNYSEEIYTGDFNGDNKTDLLIHSRTSNSKRLLRLFLGTTTGYSSSPSSLSTNDDYKPVTNPCQCIVADKNGDGYDDFIVTYKNSSNNRDVIFYLGSNNSPTYLSNASAVFQSGKTYIESELLFKGKFNNDSYEDLLILSRHSSGTKRRIYIYKATSSSFSVGKKDSSRTCYSDVNPSLYKVADIDGDGRDDFVVLFKQYGYYRYALTYRGTDSSPYILEASSSPYALASSDAFSINSPFLLGDVNGDGKKDIVTVDFSLSLARIVKSYYGLSGGSFNNSPNYYNSLYTENNYNDVIRYYIMDVNNDGYDDLVIKKKNSLSNNLNIYIYKGSSSGFNSDALMVAFSYSYYV